MELTPEYKALATAGTGRDTLRQTLRAWLHEHSTLLKFATTGVSGYFVYQLVFLLLYESSLVWFLPAKGEDLNLLVFSHSDGRLLITTLIAAELSIAAVFAGHHLWTFRDRSTAEKPIWLRFIQFNAKAAVSTLVLLTLIVNLLTLRVGMTPYLAIPAGVVAVFMWNWTWDSKFIWRRHSLPQ
jgi:putative flippase GtrA